MKPEDADRLVELALQATRLMETGKMPKEGWHEWNSWTGRMDYREESDHAWRRRVMLHVAAQSRSPVVQ